MEVGRGWAQIVFICDPGKMEIGGRWAKIMTVLPGQTRDKQYKCRWAILFICDQDKF